MGNQGHAVTCAAAQVAVGSLRIFDFQKAFERYELANGHDCRHRAAFLDHKKFIIVNLQRAIKWNRSRSPRERGPDLLRSPHKPPKPRGRGCFVYNNVWPLVAAAKGHSEYRAANSNPYGSITPSGALVVYLSDWSSSPVKIGALGETVSLPLSILNLIRAQRHPSLMRYL